MILTFLETHHSYKECRTHLACVIITDDHVLWTHFAKISKPICLSIYDHYTLGILHRQAIASGGIVLIQWSAIGSTWHTWLGNYGQFAVHHLPPFLTADQSFDHTGFLLASLFIHLLVQLDIDPTTFYIACN